MDTLVSFIIHLLIYSHYFFSFIFIYLIVYFELIKLYNNNNNHNFLKKVGHIALFIHLMIFEFYFHLVMIFMQSYPIN